MQTAVGHHGVPSNMRNEPLLIDKKRAAYLLDVSPQEIERLISRGILRTARVGHRQLLVYASLKSLCEGTVVAEPVLSRRVKKSFARLCPASGPGELDGAVRTSQYRPPLKA
jgi:hypothetical protein